MTTTICSFRTSCLVGLLCCAAAIAGETPASAPAGKIAFTVGKDTTFVSGPLNSDGTINYVAAYNEIYGKGVTPENNAAVLILRAVGPKGCLDERHLSPLLKALGMSDLPAEGEYFVRYPRPAEDSPEARQKLAKSELKAMTQPANEIEDAQVLKWLKENDKPLALLVEASKRPRFFMPWVSLEAPPTVLDGMFRYNLTMLRSEGKALTARAIVRANKGDLDGAMEDLLAIHRLARLQCQGAALVEHLVATAMDRTASRAEQGIANNVTLTARQARVLLTQTEKISPMPALSDPTDSAERLVDLDCAMVIARSGFEGLLAKNEKFMATLMPSTSQPVVALPKFEMDLDEFLRTLNKDLDRKAEDMRKGSYSECKAALEQAEKDRLPEVLQVEQVVKGDGPFDPTTGRKRVKWLIEKVGTSNPKKLAQALVQLKGSAMDSGMDVRLYGVSTACRAEHELGVISLALSAYRADRGEYPRTLDDLVPTYLAAVPLDPFTDKPMRYVPEGKSCRLYSVGPNQKDDGGIDEGSPTGKDDIAAVGKP